MKTATTRKAVKVENIFQLKTESLSPITTALEKAHEIIKKDTDAPRATITITRNTKGKKAHFTHYKPLSYIQGHFFVQALEIWRGIF